MHTRNAICAGVVGAMLFAGPVMAESIVFSADKTKACLASMVEKQDPTTCIGASANACMEATPGGWSTVGMGACLDAERAYWDARLNAAYTRVRTASKAVDADMKELGSSAPLQADALVAMRRAWITYRDTTCDYERSLWGGGTGGGPATVSCHMYMTAEQALYLEAQQGIN